MKNSLTNPIKYNKVIIIEAIMLTVVIHILFFYIFSVPQIRRHKSAKANTTVTLLRFGGDNASAAKMQNYIRRYNPANFAGTASPFGYNTFHQPYSRTLPKIKYLNYDAMQIRTNAETGKIILPANNVRNISLPYRELAYTGQKNQLKTPYPFAISSSGVTVPLTFSTEEQRMIKEFPLSVGIYKIFKNSATGTIRLALLQSCGRRALDKLSMKFLYQEINKFANCSDGEIFTVYYREPEITGGEL